MTLQQRNGIHSEFLVVLLQNSFACKFGQAADATDAKVLCAADLQSTAEVSISAFPDSV